MGAVFQFDWCVGGVWEIGAEKQIGFNQKAECCDWQTKAFRLSCSWAVSSHWKSLQLLVQGVM